MTTVLEAGIVGLSTKRLAPNLHKMKHLLTPPTGSNLQSEFGSTLLNDLREQCQSHVLYSGTYLVGVSHIDSLPSHVPLKPDAKSLKYAGLREGMEIEGGTIWNCIIDELQPISKLRQRTHNLHMCTPYIHMHDI